MEMRISLDGNKRVSAHLGDGKFVIETDQPKDDGGDGTAPEPFTYFLASLGTCAGIYVVFFCEARSIPTEGIEIVQSADFDEKTHKLVKVSLEIRVPASFPVKYHKALARAASSCTVKRTILSPPELDVQTVVTAGQ